MGHSKSLTNTANTETSSATFTPKASDLETQLNQIGFDQFNQGNGQQTGVQNTGLSLVQALLSGSQLPGAYGNLYGGISPEVTQSIVNQSLNDIQPYFAKAGLLDSGVNAQISARTAADIRNQSAQFNLQNLGNLLGIGIQGQGMIQQPIIAQQSLLSQRLQGLRSNQQTGNSSSQGNTTVTGMNPFIQSFETSFGSSLGSTLGKPKVSVGPFSFGG